MNRRRHFVRTCKKHGLHVQPAALQSMMQQVNDEEFLLQALKWLNHALASKSPKIVTPGLWEEAAEACSDVSPVEKKCQSQCQGKTRQRRTRRNHNCLRDAKIDLRFFTSTILLF